MKKSDIIFISVPESLKSDFSFSINTAIPLPVETNETAESFQTENLNREMILSGMLRVIAEPEIAEIPPEWTAYYRRFVLTVKPEIYHEFTSAAIVKAKNGEYDMALEINAILEGLFPASPGVLLNKALILEKKDNTEALQAYEAVLSIEPVLPDAFFNAGFFFMRLRDFVRARDCFSRYMKVGEEPEKKKQAKIIIQELNNQGLEDSRFKEAYDYINSGDNEAGLSKIQEYIEKYPKAWNGWFVLGWVLRKLGRYEDGLRSLNKAMELGANNSDIQNEMAICLMELGEPLAARRELELALKKEPENTKIISNLGVLAMKSNKKDEAAAFFRTVLELEPNDPLAKHFLNEL